MSCFLGYCLLSKYILGCSTDYKYTIGGSEYSKKYLRKEGKLKEVQGISELPLGEGTPPMLLVLLRYMECGIRPVVVPVFLVTG
jgi:hypothetical protein